MRRSCLASSGPRQGSVRQERGFLQAPSRLIRIIDSRLHPSIRAVARRPVSLALALCLLLAACYTTSYVKEAQANAELLSQLADKLDDYCRAGFMIDGRQVSSEEMGEFYYALRKARLWAATAQPSHGDCASYRAFVALEGAYETFVRDADRFRLEHASADLDTLGREHAAVERRAGAVMKALARENQ